MGLPKSVQAVTDYKLPFAAHNAGLGDNGELIICDTMGYLYQMEHDGEDYKETWKKELPDEMKYDCNKGISSDDCIVLHEYTDEKTVCYDDSLTKLTELQQQGALVDSSKDELFFAQGTPGETDWQIIVHKTVMEGKKLQLVQHRTLKPPSPHGWDATLSACRTVVGYVVVEYNTSSMDIFDEDGRKYLALESIYFIAEHSVRRLVLWS